jgi:L-asparaginase
MNTFKIRNTVKIQFITTGGTVDSYWSGKHDTAKVNEHSYLPEFFKNLDLYSELDFVEVCLKDSRELTQADVQKVVETVEKSKIKNIIITHGTYTMPDTARYLQVNLKRKDQTIILTGSMTPLKGFEPSDASFNLGYAVSKVQELKPGIYICMNGATFTPDEVAKSLSEGKFYSIFKPDYKLSSNIVM